MWSNSIRDRKEQEKWYSAWVGRQALTETVFYGVVLGGTLVALYFLSIPEGWRGKGH